MRLLPALFLLLISQLSAQVKLTVRGQEAVLDEALIRCELHGGFLLRHRELTFFNPGKRAAEGELICPLDPGETIVSYAMTVNGERREGVVVPEKRGRRAYEAIVRQKVDPGIIEVDEVKNEFRTRIFPIFSQKQKKVWISTIRSVDPGKVSVWPAGFGSPKSWRLEIETLGGEAGKFKKITSGENTPIPARVIDWKITPNLTYCGTDGDLRQVSPAESAAQQPKSVELWIDGSSAITPESLTSLKALFKTFGNSQVTARLMRRKLSKFGEFQLVKGEAPALIAQLEKEKSSDMCLPERLPWKDVQADAVIFLTNGNFVTGKFDPSHLRAPLHIIDSGKGTSRWLRNAALLSGGGWHGAQGLDPMAGSLIPKDSVIGTYRDVLWQSVSPLAGDGSRSIESPVADWLRAKLISTRMKEMGAPEKEIEKFNREHTVMDENSAMLVLETAAQYQRYGFEPPKSDQALYATWAKLKKPKMTAKRKPGNGLLSLWRKRCERLEKAPVSIHQRLQMMVERSKIQWEESIERFEEIEAKDVQDLMDELNALGKMLADGIEKEEIAGLKKRLLNLNRLDQKAAALKPLIDVVIGGQVRRPGKHSLLVDATLGDAVKAAGGSTPYGAVNRVKLYRNGRVYSYNLKIKKHRNVRLYQLDVIEVPQRRWYGNGGGEGQTKPPFVEDNLTSVTFTPGEYHPQGFYLEPLDQALTSGDFQKRYFIYRESCGWRADYFLDVIELLERREKRNEAFSVAGDLASHMPDHPENLIKAARAFSRLGAHDEAILLCRRAIELAPKRYQHHYQLARCLKNAGHAEEAVRAYWESILIGRHGFRSSKIGIVPLEEMNALIFRAKLDGEKLGIDPAFIKHVPVKVRAVLDWDAYQSNLDLVIHHPALGWVSRVAPEVAEDISVWSMDVYRGHGPESWCSQSINPGEYRFSAKFYGDWDESRRSTVTAEIEVTTDFGMPNEKRHRHSLRLTEKENKVVTSATIWPEGWE